MVATSCKEVLEDVLSTEIAINNRTVVFDVNAAATKSAETATRAGATEETLYDGVLNINIAQELEKQGFSFENIKSFLITQGTLEEEIPSGYDLKGFVGAKLYFDNTSKLVARADKVENNKVRFTIVNGELLNQLKDDKLHVILAVSYTHLDVYKRQSHPTDHYIGIRFSCKRAKKHDQPCCCTLSKCH